MIFICFIVNSLIVIVISDCDICIDGRCQTRITLMKNVDITDQLAIDWTDNILYVQLNSVINTAWYISDFAITKMQVVQIFQTSGMVVRQDTQEFYTADFNSNIYKISKGTNEIEIESTGILDGSVDFMFYHDRLYFTKKGENNLFYLDKANLVGDRNLANFTITGFVKTEKGVFFVSNDTVYEHKRPFTKPPKVLISSKNMTLSVDKYDNVYMGSASKKIIYRKLNATNQLYVYAAYKKGTVDQFVFDKEDNVIVHDAKDRSLAIWKEERTTCTIVLPHCNVQINVHKTQAEELEEEEEEGLVSIDDHTTCDNNDNVVDDFVLETI